MAATVPSTSLVPVQPVFTDAERLALAGYLAGYRGLTREAYTLDLRQFTAWCRTRSVSVFAVRRADIETFARELEAKGRARATVTRRLCTIAGFYKYAVQEELLEHSPAAHVRRPRLDYESHATALDRNEFGALLVAAGLGPPAEHALISLLALNGLQVSEATGADIEHLGLERAADRPGRPRRRPASATTTAPRRRPTKGRCEMTGYHTRWARPQEPAHDPERIAIREALAFGKALYHIRTALGLSVAELTMRAAMADDDIERIEEGGTEPTIPLLRRLAAALDADVRLTAGHDLGSVWFETHAA